MKLVTSISIVVLLAVASIAPAKAHFRDYPRRRKAHIVHRAEWRIGRDYCWGGTSRCFDCSGLTYKVFYRHGANLPHSTRRQWRARHRDGWRTIQRRRDLQRGDLLFFKNTYRDGISHVGIYVGDGKFVHAGDSVQKDSLGNSYWRKHYHAGVRPRSLRHNT